MLVIALLNEIIMEGHNRICIFNPEHDLCLANGSAHFVPPQSSLRFAAEGAALMSILYPEAECLPALRVGEVCRRHGAPDRMEITPWGWNLALKTLLLKQGIPSRLLPSGEYLADLRRLQHRATLLPLQPQSRAATSLREVEEMLVRTPSLVMKAPWSGSGRGLRWVRERLSEHDKLWMLKMVREQECVIVEPRREVLADFALEYCVQGGDLRFVGYSLFASANGVYQHNILLSDEKIARRVGFTEGDRRAVEAWLLANIAPRYEGPLGIDCLHTPDGNSLSEINLRHTMGLLAHEYLRQHPAAEGTVFSPSAWLGR